MSRKNVLNELDLGGPAQLRIKPGGAAPSMPESSDKGKASKDEKKSDERDRRKERADSKREAESKNRRSSRDRGKRDTRRSRSRDRRTLRESDSRREQRQSSAERSSRTSKSKQRSKNNSGDENFEVAPSIFGKQLPKSAAEKPSCSKRDGGASPASPDPNLDIDFTAPANSKECAMDVDNSPSTSPVVNGVPPPTLPFKLFPPLVMQAQSANDAAAASNEQPPVGPIEKPKKEKKRSTKEFAEKYQSHIHDTVKAVVVPMFYAGDISKQEYKQIMRSTVVHCLKYRIRSRADIRLRSYNAVQEFRKTKASAAAEKSPHSAQELAMILFGSC